MKKEVDHNNRRIIEAVYFVMIFIVSLFLLYRCRFALGAALSDEFSQPATVNRYLHGDIPLLENWSASTMFSAFVMSLAYKLLGVGMVPILTARYIYVIFQVAIVLAVYFLIPGRRNAVKVGCIAYLCSTPYNINRITYNTLSIGLFMLFCALFFCGNKSESGKRIVLSGAVFSLAVLAIPHNAILFMIYVVTVLVMALMHKKGPTLFSVKKLIYLISGIMLVAVPFIFFFLRNGSLGDYVMNLKFIFSDSEYSKSIFLKLLESQYKLIRVYWRVWVPLVVMDIIMGLFLRDNDRALKYAYFFSNLVVCYGVIRFAFVYGSVSINLAVPPVFFWGMQSVVLSYIFGDKLHQIYNNYELSAWIIAGYLFYICEYLATDTEILSGSATFIVAAIPSGIINYEYLKSFYTENKLYYGAVYGTVSCVIIACLFILRMTYVWGDAPITELDEKIDDGPAKGIYTTHESVEAFRREENVISLGDIEKDDQVLVLPMNPTYYYLADAGCASPYIFRFEVSVKELDNYYSLHADKLPTVIIACKKDDSGNKYDMDECLEYFENMADMGYYEYYNSDDAIILKR